MGRRRKHARRQLRGSQATELSAFGTVEGIRSLLRTGPIKMRAAYAQPEDVPFSAATVRAAVEKLRADHYDPEIRAARQEAWQKEEDDLQREWDEWGRDAWIARYGQGEQQ